MARRLSSCAVLLLLAACTGSIGTSEERDLTPPVLPRGDAPSTCALADLNAPRDVPLRRLTSEELANTLRDLLGAPLFAQIEASNAFPGESVGGGDLHGFQALHVEEHVRSMFDLGEVVADAMLDPSAGDLHFDCGNDAACVRAFVAEFAPRVHRRPLTRDEAAAYLQSFYDEATPAEGLRALMMRLLSSPAFLFHTEFAGETREGALVLDDYAVASRLSYRILRTMPTDALFAAAARQELHTPAQIDGAAAELLDDARARETVWRFFEQWLELDEPLAIDTDPALLRGLDANGLDEALVEEVRTFVEHVFWNDGDFAELYGSRRVQTDDPRVAAIYGVNVPVDETGEERAGLALRAALLQSATLSTSPIGRGVFVLRRLLCETLPSPDLTTINERLSDVQPADRTMVRAREIIDGATGDAPCSSCHARINPVAFALEDFDRLGRHRPRDEEVINNGEVIATFPWQPSDAQLELDGALVSLGRGADLAATLVQSPRAQSCLAERLIVHTQHRELNEHDACALSAMEELVREGASLRELFLRAALDAIELRRL